MIKFILIDKSQITISHLMYVKFINLILSSCFCSQFFCLPQSKPPMKRCQLYVKFFQSHPTITKTFRFSLKVYLHNMFQPSTGSSSGTNEINYKNDFLACFIYNLSNFFSLDDVTKILLMKCFDNGESNIKSNSVTQA